MKGYPLILNFYIGDCFRSFNMFEIYSSRQLFSSRENHGLFRASRILPFSIDPSVMNIYLSCCE